ncbi:unnamed protein product [Ostreobium quekettii]|uniref:Histone deacetylase n=1 Tax=Ostreobium quekettii TaxID=121088 RepID=A0A8S1IQE3_9CHLO|nr:unnamed protein product [Ostreobium quekettii]
MKPQRVLMTQSLVLHYGLHNYMEICKPVPASDSDLAAFHSSDYVSFLKHVSPDEKFQEQFAADIEQFIVGVAVDCPVFHGLYQYCQSYAGASVGGAQRLNHGYADTVVNWSGGMHHAKKAEASGFCFVNDIVLAILELLKYHQRVLYVDIDVHHGDGVEEAFLMTNRVMTVSFHKHGDSFFPGTGELNEVGRGPGKYYTVNVPIKDGIDDQTYVEMFKLLTTNIMKRFEPTAIVFQCGADSLGGDKLGVFNLSIQGHASCLQYMQSFGVPMLVLGGGGYTVKNVARCWAYETGTLAGVELAEDLPATEFLELYEPGYQLDSSRGRQDIQNANDTADLLKMQQQILANLSHVYPVGKGFHERAPDACVPSVKVASQHVSDGLMAATS